MKLVVYPDVDIWEFVLSGLKDRSDVLLYPLNQYCNIFQKVVRKYTNTSLFPSSFVIGSELRKEIRSLKTGDSLVLADYTDSTLLFAIMSIIPKGVAHYIWLWNHKGKNPGFANNLLAIIKSGFQVFTYDELDAERYCFKWHSQFFNIKPYQKTSLYYINISYDFLFIGYSKNRVEEIAAVSSMLESYSCKFYTVQHSDDYIPYYRYMEMAMHARCIVEIVHSGDSSCTLRPLEAISIRRKLLTNNPAVRRYAFYHPQNIFILGEDDISKLSVFLHSPFIPLPDEIVDSYDVNSWVDIFN